MDQASRGAAALSAKEYDSALTAYTKALIEHPTSPDYWTQRSTIFARLTDFTSALRDADFAVLCGQKRAKREKIQAGQQRRVVALYGLERYGDAKLILDSMKKYRNPEKKPDKMEGDMWAAKVERKLANLEEGDERGRATIKEYPEQELPDTEQLKKDLKASLEATKSTHDDEDFIMRDTEQTNGTTEFRRSSAANLTKVLSGGPNASSESIPEKGIKVDSEAIITHEPNPDHAAATVTSTTTVSAPSSSKVRHEWFQSPERVTVTVYAKGVPKDKVDIDIRDDSLSIAFPHPAEPTSSFSLSFDPLYAAVESSSSTFRVLSTKIEVVLLKRLPGNKWSTFEGTGSPLATKTNASTTTSSIISTKEDAPGPSYPTSSKSGPKDWDKVASDLSSKSKPKDKDDKKKEGAEDEDSDFEGGDPVDGFFKKLYAGADEDTRRAMMKSYYESNGTSLSTNWGEVGKGKVEPVPPKDD